MHRVCRLTGGVACLVLLLWGGLSWGEPPNPTPSDNLGNTAGGLHALSDNTTGYDNTAFGIGALLNNMDGSVNTASGAYALLRNTTGDLNTASGAYALRNNMTGDSNTAVGESALGFNISGSGNIVLGRWAGLILTSGDRNIYLGNLGVAAESDTMRLGGVQTRTFIAGITGVPVSGSTMLISSTGQVGIEVSSARYKRDIQPMGALSRGLLQLRPVTFRYKQDMQGERQYGLIAEEVAAIPDSSVSL